MNIEDRRDNVNFSQLKVGECFEYELFSSKYWMKTEQDHSAVSLSNGEMATFSYGATVKPINAKVVIE